jgi:uncharacterized protein
MNHLPLKIYDQVVLKRPYLSLLFVAIVFIFFASYIPNFKLDASAESLVLENDKDLEYFREISKEYGTQDFLIITYTPNKELLSEDSLEGIRELRTQLEKLNHVSSVTTILDAPLLNSPKIDFTEIGKNVRSLQTPDIDKTLALKEFRESPVYRKLLVSPDGKTTAILVNYKRDEIYFSLLNERNDLRQKKTREGLTDTENTRLETVTEAFNQHTAKVLDKQGPEIEQVRKIIDTQRHRGEMFLGGVPMISSDMIDYIRHDISIFGWGILLLMIVALAAFFQKIRWITFPLACCAISTLVIVGLLGFLDWRVTVISSNFISILLVITISLVIHLIVRYGELYVEFPDIKRHDIVYKTVEHMFLPCFYTSITTIAAFASLVTSGIRPVIDFGWMMTLGIIVAFCLSFIFFPACLVLLPPLPSVSAKDITKKLTNAFASFTLNRTKLILLLGGLLALFCFAGVSQLQVENRFIDYFKPSTEIYRGMRVIDQQLGGTTPLDIVIDANKDFFKYLKEIEAENKEPDPFADDPFSEASEKEIENYWFHSEQLLFAEKIHDYLESLPEIGKALSIATTVKVLKILNDDKLPEDYDLALIRKLLPEDLKKIFMHPYLSKDANQIRFSARIEEVNPKLNRGKLIEKIRKHLVEEMHLEPERIHFTGMAVLYNNMLHSLYQSQILTLGTVFLGILIMFIILFKRVYLSVLAIIPNLLSAGLVLGIMGWFKIPLDMMTITIAAITIGIAVDDTIHYIYRFKEEFAKSGNYQDTLKICHGSIGRAIYYTSITVTFGFSVLTLSNFIPTIYFGMLTGVAMIVALLNNLTLLPALIMTFKPLGPENATSEAKLNSQPA